MRGRQVADRAAVAGGAAASMSIHDEARRGFGRGADAYERGRPGYPPKAIRWLERRLELGPGRTVVDVGAGTGKLTRELVASGADVLAVEPVPAMRAVLERAVPEARALEGTAESLPVGDGSVDAIVVAQAFHWFDGPAALAEFHRVLRPDGRIALIWNRRLREQPLHRAISEIIEPYRGDTPTQLSRRVAPVDRVDRAIHAGRRARGAARAGPRRRASWSTGWARPASSPRCPTPNASACSPASELWRPEPTARCGSAM